MATVTTSSFTSSVVTTLDGWRAFVDHDREPMALLGAAELGRLTPAERTAYDDERSDYHAELPALRTPVLDRTVTKGLLFMRLNRGQQMGTPCGMILSGVPGVGKTTAVKALGRTVEQAYRKKNPQMTGTVPVVYITMPTGQHPKALPAELLYFLGAPYAPRTSETALTHQACHLMTI
jgi:Cdc6-like AAA superfamily ATPase